MPLQELYELRSKPEVSNPGGEPPWGARDLFRGRERFFGVF